MADPWYSADGLSTDNQTGLAIKGIIAIKAMSQMSLSVDMTTDFEKYSSTSSRLYAQWKSLALTDDKHLLEVYGDMKSSSLGYDLFPDLWLNTSVVESSVYNGQISFIYNLSLYPDTTGWADYPWWNLFMAAMTPNQDLRTNLISMTVKDNAFFDTAEISLGAMYAPLALKVPVKLTANSTTVTPSKSRTTIRGVLIGVAALLVIVAIALVVWRRRRQSHRRTSVVPSSFEVMSQGTQVTVTPFNPTGSTLTEVPPLDAGPQRDSQRFAHRPSSSEDPPVPLRRVVTAPVGLSSKELARLRSLANRPRSRPIDDQPSNSPLTAAARTDRDALGGAAAAVTSSPEVQILRSEVNVLRDEIQRLHTETRIVSESPPSYASGAA
ncbi:hypothetical protein EDB84DRAFT_1582798 [Lactarius hengduanensis]|nr:hypothetical protein EDB84DRAFT_1582798 [Lactarius hengduanensis]